MYIENRRENQMKYSLTRLLKNIKYLMENDIREDFNKAEYKTLNDIEKNYIYELSDKLKSLNKPKILDYEKTLELITTEKKSFCRIGDGEIDIMNGKDIPFQHYDEKLAKIMINILEDDKIDMYVGINYSYFYNTSYMEPTIRKFYLMGNPEHRKLLLEKCNLNRTYINATFNQTYVGDSTLNHEKYYKALQHMFKGHKLVIFSGKGVVDKLKYDLFELAESKETIYGPSMDAFSEYDNILDKARTYSKEHIMCFILGPASKALVYQLTKEGYMAWDIGHMAKDYNAFREKKIKDKEFINSFYAPD